MDKKTIARRYEIEDELGSGGMGTVYRANDLTTSQTVAIKRLKPTLTDVVLIERFKREGEALCKLNHPNIVKMLDAIEEEGNHYLVMEYVSGGDLKNLIEQKGMLDHQRCVDMAIDLADALTRAHRINIIHRDLKPANVLIGNDGVLRLTDFGVAHVLDKGRLTTTDTVVGTLDYLSPEALNGETIDARTDIWAFGVMLFEMLTGQRPFQGATLTATVTAILNKPLPDLEALSPEAPIALVDLIYRMLERDTAARINSVRHVGAELEDILRGHVNKSRPTRFETTQSDTLFVDHPKHNLPAQATVFVGRQAEVTELTRLLIDPRIRLVTVLGQGGMGKTRLSLEVARQLRGKFENGIYLVELAPLNDSNNIVSAIANAMGYQFQSDGRDAKQQILDFLEKRTLLLVMDNFEHLLMGASLVTEILNAAPNAKILATSRQILNQSGETVFNLAGMDFPKQVAIEDLVEHAAVELFSHSAKRVHLQFEITAENVMDIASICISVEGMPLAIMLAASWIGVLSVEEIASEIKEGINFLRNDMTDLPERQHSIKAVFDYSWNLMTDDERDAFMMLSVFRGGFTRQAAQTITNTKLFTLRNLTNKSLIRRDAESGRYTIHELLRQYGEEQMSDAGKGFTARTAHMRFYTTFMADLEDDIKGKRQLSALTEIDIEFQNIRQAWQQALIQKEIVVIDKSLESLHIYSYMRNQFQESIELFQMASKVFKPVHSEKPQFIWGRILARLSLLQSLYSVNGEHISSKLETSLKIARDGVAKSEIAFSLLALGYYNLGVVHDYPAALNFFEQSLEIFRQIDDTYYITRSLHRIGLCHGGITGTPLFMKYTQESLELALEHGNKIDAALTLINLGSVPLVLGDYTQAEDYFNRGLTIANEVGDFARSAMGKAYLGLLKFLSGRIEDGRELAEEGLILSTDVNNSSVKAYCLTVLALCAVVSEDYLLAVRLSEESLASPSNPFGVALAHWSLSIAYCGLANYAESKRHTLKLASGFFLSRPASLTWLLPALALVLAQDNQKVRATEYLSLAFNHSLSPTGWFQEWKLIVQLRRSLEGDLGTENYYVAWERGKNLDLDMVLTQMQDENGDETK